MMDRELVAERATAINRAVRALAVRTNAPETADVRTGVLLVGAESFRTMSYLVQCCDELEKENKQLVELLDNSIGMTR